jgi:1-deoxy-D-xylulose-5-phosphate synthase
MAVHNLGLPDRFVEHGDHATLLSQCGLDAAGIENTVNGLLEQAGTSTLIAK